MEWVNANKELFEKARLELSAIPGVVGCGYGLKEKNYRCTDEISIRVYVRRKKAMADLLPSEIIPAEIYGFRTDVLPALTSKDMACQDMDKHDEVIGGLTLAHSLTEPDPSLHVPALAALGTIGCVVSINTISSRNHYGILTNHHVLAYRGGKKGDAIYQPRLVMSPPDSAVDPTPIPVFEGEWKDTNRIGTIHDMGLRDNYKFSYRPGVEQPEDYYVDCGVGWLDTRISSCCHTVCGTHFNSTILKMGVGDNNHIRNVRRVTDDDIGKEVIKIGRSTGRTKGIIKDGSYSGDFIDGDTAEDPSSGDVVTRSNIIIVEYTESDAECTPSFVFLDHGDSGWSVA